MFWFVILVVTVVYSHQVDAQLNLEIKKYQMCEGIDTPVKHHATLTKINATVMSATGDFNLPFDIGEETTITITIDHLKDGEWKELYKVEEKNPCKLFNKYGGDMWFDLQEKVGVKKGACPLPKGEFAVTDHILDFTRLPIKEAPKGSARFTSKMTRGDEVICCIYGEVDSI